MALVPLELSKLMLSVLTSSIHVLKDVFLYSATFQHTSLNCNFVIEQTVYDYRTAGIIMTANPS